MEQLVYEQWWQHHPAVARGENLNATEQAFYEAGLADLDGEEEAQWEDANLALLRGLKAEIEHLETLHTQLQSRSQRLDRQIWTLEGATMGLTGLELSSHLTRETL